MVNARIALIAAALAVAIGASVSIISAAAPATPATPAATAAATQVGSVSGKVIDKDGKPASGAAITYLPVTTAPAAAPAAGGAAGGRGAGRGGRGRGLGNATSNDKGEFTMADVPVGDVNFTATLTAADGTRQRGTTAAPVTVKEKVETKIADPIKLADAPAGRGGRGGAGGAPATTAPAATASRPAGM